MHWNPGVAAVSPFQKSGSWLVVVPPNPPGSMSFQLQRSLLAASLIQCFMVQCLSKGACWSRSGYIGLPVICLSSVKISSLTKIYVRLYDTKCCSRVSKKE